MTSASFALNKRYRSRFGLNDDKISEAEKGLDSLLERYGFALTDDFDRVLLDGVRSGFFDVSKLKTNAEILQDKYNNDAAQKALDLPWQKYRDSFDNNGNEIASELSNAIRDRVSNVTVSYLDAAVSFLKGMGRDEEARSNQMLHEA
jgi:hypothetical protein